MEKDLWRAVTHTVTQIDTDRGGTSFNTHAHCIFSNVTLLYTAACRVNLKKRKEEDSVSQCFAKNCYHAVSMAFIGKKKKRRVNSLNHTIVNQDQT